MTYRKRSPVLIHVGWQKTGSTWLQQELFHEKINAYYPLRVVGDQYYSDVKSVGSLIHNHKGCYLNSLLFKEIKWDLNRRIYESGNWNSSKVAVVSNERLVGSFHNGAFDGKEMADRLKFLFPEGKILLVIREQKDIILSGHYQYLRIGGTLSLNRYLRTSYGSRTPVFQFDQLKYHRLISYYQELFGKSNVLVLPYELLRTDPASFVEHINLFSGASYVEHIDYGNRPNVGLNKYVTHSTRLLNLLIIRSTFNGYSPFRLPKWARKLVLYFRGALGRMVPDSIQEKFIDRQREQVAELVGNRYGTSNQTLEQLTNLDLVRYGYDLSEEETLSRDVSYLEKEYRPA